MSKFDGPNFINPLHTSFAQNQGSYQNPILAQNLIKNNETLDRKIGVPGGGKININQGWNEEDGKSSINANISQKIKNNFNSDQNSEKKYETMKVTMITYESKLIDDLLISNSILIKPSDNQINEFINRIKNLNKSIISKILMDKIENSDNKSDQNKMFIVKIFY